MIEAIEIKKELEPPTETDVSLLFADLKKPIEALQTMFVSAVNSLKKDGIDIGKPRLQIEDGEITIYLGNVCLWYQVKETVWNLGESSAGK